MGKTNLSDFERGVVVGARCTGLCQELKSCWVFHTQHFPVYIKNGPTYKGHSDNLTQLWEALESASLWNAFDILQSPCPDEMKAVLRAKGGATQY